MAALPREIEERTDLDGLIVVGASGAGKSTLLRLLREQVASDRIAFPVRYTTRKMRPDDDPAENAHITPLDLERKLEADDILVSWAKPIGNGTEYYAFERVGVSVIVLGGNEALIENNTSVRPTSSILDKLLKVVVWCDEETRLNRLLARSPELVEKRAEFLVRTKPASNAVIEAADLVVDNTRGFPEDLIDSLVCMLERLVESRLSEIERG